MQDIEIAPRNSRGFFLLVHIVGYAFGSCAVAVVGYVVANQSDLGWRLLFAMGTLPAFTVLLVTPWLYETPHRWDHAGVFDAASWVQRNLQLRNRTLQDLAQSGTASFWCTRV